MKGSNEVSIKGFRLNPNVAQILTDVAKVNQMSRANFIKSILIQSASELQASAIAVGGYDKITYVRGFATQLSKYNGDKK